MMEERMATDREEFKIRDSVSQSMRSYRLSDLGKSTEELNARKASAP